MPKRKSQSKGTPSKKQKGGSHRTSEKEDKILVTIMAYREEGDEEITFEKLAVDLGCHERNNGWRAAWSSVKGAYLEPSDSGKGMKLSETGFDYVSSNEFKEATKHLVVPKKTNEDHQERIKDALNDKHKAAAVQIFDLLLEYAPLTRVELASIMGISDRNHNFSYGFQELKMKKGYIEVDKESSGKGKKLRLSDKAFLKPADRPETKPLTPELLSKMTETKNKASNKNTSKKAKAKIAKTESSKSKKIDKNPVNESAEEDQEEDSTKDANGSDETTFTGKDDPDAVNDEKPGIHEASSKDTEDELIEVGDPL